MRRQLDSDPVAELAKKPADVVRAIAELVARINVGPFRVPDRVGRAAAVGLDQAAQEPPRMGLDDRLLPRLEHDRPPMLHPGSVLGEHARPMAGEGADHIHVCVGGMNDADPVSRREQGGRGDALVDDQRVGAIEEDPESVHVARPGRDRAIAEIEAEEIRVGEVGHAGDRKAVAGAAHAGPATPSGRPVRRRRQPTLAGWIARRRSLWRSRSASLLRRRQLAPAQLRRASTSDYAAGGTRTHKCFRTAAFETAAFAKFGHRRSSRHSDDSRSHRWTGGASSAPNPPLI